ncbi:MAG: hypothetical protein PHN57_03120 [Candidatus Omnitrophica bacterium]|nr:hypothetical protein [Candidatus Omnitrophota bacterium]
MQWESKTQEKFQLMISKIPVFHRHITEEVVTGRAEENARLRNASLVEERDLAGAFFSDVPSPFYSMMIRLLDEVGIDYRKYGFPKENNGK